MGESYGLNRAVQQILTKMGDLSPTSATDIDALTSQVALMVPDVEEIRSDIDSLSSMISAVKSGARIQTHPKLSTDDIKFARLTGTSTGVVTYEVTSTTGLWSLLEVRAHLSAVGAAGTLDVVLDNGAVATVYDIKLLSEPLTTVTDVYWQPDRDIYLNAADHLDITWTSPTTGSAVTFGFETVYKVL